MKISPTPGKSSLLGIPGHLAPGLEGGACGRPRGASPAREEVAVGGVHFLEVVEIGEDDGQLDEAPRREEGGQTGGGGLRAHSFNTYVYVNYMHMQVSRGFNFVGCFILHLSNILKTKLYP